MKEEYKGHEISATREDSMTGDELLFYSIFRISDGYECTSGFDYSDDSEGQFIERLKKRVDNELKDPDPWGEYAMTEEGYFLEKMQTSSPMLQIKDYFPIDRDKVKKRWDEIMNIPNDQWNLLGVERKIEIINDPDYPGTLRSVQLNMLPALIIEIIKKG